MVECSADLDHPCDSGVDEDGEPAPCESCKASLDADERYFRAMWNRASPEERNPEKYRQNLINAGRGHLLP